MLHFEPWCIRIVFRIFCIDDAYSCQIYLNFRHTQGHFITSRYRQKKLIYAAASMRSGWSLCR